MLNVATIAQIQMNIEVNAKNRKRLSELLTALIDGLIDANGRVLRHPMSVNDLAQKLKVTRTTVWTWREDDRFPKNSAILEDLAAVVGAGNAAFQAYFKKELTLRELLSLGSIVRPKESLEDVWNSFLQLDLPDQLQFESRVLMRRAETLESPNQMMASASNQKKVADAPNSAILLNALDKSRENMAQVGERWSDKELLRVQSLLQESLKKSGRKGDPVGATEDAGVSSSSFDPANLRRLEYATLDQLRHIHFTSGLVNAIAAICYEVVGWDGVFPSQLLDSTYRNRSEALLKDLANHERQGA